MTSSIDNIQSTAVVVQNPSQQVIPHGRTYLERKRTHDLAMNRSFKTQIADRQFLHSMKVQDRILTGTYAQLEIGSGLPNPFGGTCDELLLMIAGTVHTTIDRLDYNGSLPYLKIVDQLEKGKSFEEVSVDSRNEEFGSTCIGMAHAILKDLKDEHNVDGVLALERKSPSHPLEHGAALIECSDGFVLLEARSNPNQRIFSIPFGTTQVYPGFSMTAAHPGSTTPLILKSEHADYEYCTNVGNGDDLVMKHFVMHAPFDHGHEYFPIATYNKDGSDRKFIGVSLKESSIFLKDRKAPNGIRAENISFRWILDNLREFREKLTAFMEPKESMDPNASFSGFHIPTEMAYQQLVRLASQESRVQRLFIEASPKAIL